MAGRIRKLAGAAVETEKRAQGLWKVAGTSPSSLIKVLGGFGGVEGRG